MLTQKDKMKSIDMTFRWRKLFVAFLVMTLFASLNGCAKLSMQERLDAQNNKTADMHKSETRAVDKAEYNKQNSEKPVGTIENQTGDLAKIDSGEGSVEFNEKEALKRKEEKTKAVRNNRTDENITRIILEPEKQVVNLPEQNQGNENGTAVNFDNADLYEVVRTIAEILNINYIIDPNVRGVVSIHTSGRISREDLLPLFYQILEINGLSMVREGDVYKIIKSTDTVRQTLLTMSGRNYENIPVGERPILQLIPLKYISAAEMTTIITPFLSTNAFISSHRKNLIVMDKALNIQKLLKLIDVFDINLMDKYYHKIFPVVHISANEAESLLNNIFASYGVGKENLTLIPVDRAGLIIAISEREEYFEKIDAFLSQFDIPTADTESRIYIYSVKNGSADDLSLLLQNVFTDVDTSIQETAGTTEGTEKKTTALFREQRREGNRETVSEGSSLSGSIRITADLVRNALIIEATPKDYQVIESMLSQIDIPPRQVLIEVTIAEITLDNTTSLGVDWAYTHGIDNPSSTSGPGKDLYGILSTAGESGLQYLVGNTNQWKATLNAAAIDSKLNLLSTPSILASDNKEAKIEISTENPVISSVYDTSTGGDNSTITTNVQYRDTGIILSVTPHINQNGLVSMEISQEVSDALGPTEVSGQSYPTFFKRSIDTTLVVRNNQTIVIGGLMTEKKGLNRNGVPFFSKIPLIGFLFGSRNSEKHKVELILLITPRVITDMTDVDEVTENFRRKVTEVRSWMESVQ